MGRRGCGRLRIIGGEWRSRLIAFDPADGPLGHVRPTPDRVRQTLFDWLAPLIGGSRCLDLFAGSGALGLEALSRGAAHVTFVETGAPQVRAIREALSRLDATDRAEVIHDDALHFLADHASRLPPPASRSYDLVFLDPPFGSQLLPESLPRLPALLSASHRVYLEWQAGAPPPLPAGWRLLREKRAGQVKYGLAVYRVSGG